MSYAAIHPDWEKPRRNMVDGYSLEMTAKELDGLREAAPLIRPGTQVAVGIGGHPEGHPNNTPAELWDWMERKLAAIRARGMVPLVVTQFAFDDDAIVAWVKEMRTRGIDVPVRLGVPGPAGIKRLLGFAKRCGVGASASVMKKYGISLTNLIGSAGPDKLVDSLDRKLSDEEHGRVRLHFYPFGALTASAEWINAYDAKHQ